MKGEFNRLLAQGYTSEVLDKNPSSRKLIRWTPLACVVFGTIGILTASWQYFVVLGLLNLFGAITSTSFYDLIYRHVFAPFLKWGEIPPHSWHRKIGCAMGAVIYLNAGLYLYLNHYLLAYIPVILLLSIALTAGIFNWCFVTSVATIFSSRKTKCC